MEQQPYRSGLSQMPGFQPRKRAKFDKQRDAFNEQARRNQQQQAETIRQNTDVDIRNAEQAGRDVKALSVFSKTLTDYLTKETEKRNDEQMQRGMMDVYENGMDTTTHDEGVDALRGVHLETDNIASGLESKGADVFVGEKVRKSSGWREYGRVVAMSQLGATNYPAFAEAALADAEVTVIDENGQKRTITLDTATEPEEYAALRAEVRSKFLEQYRGINPAVLNEHLFPGMRKEDALGSAAWSRQRAGVLKDENTQSAFSDFKNGSVNIADTWTLLTNSGMPPGDARKKLINMASEMYINEEISEEQYQAIKDTPFGRGGTWGSTNRSDFDAGVDQARRARIEAGRLADAELQQAYDKEVQGILKSFREGNYSREQLDTIMDRLKVKYPGVDANRDLQEFYDNSTIEGRTEEELDETLESMWRSGELTVRELQSGKYANLDGQAYQKWLQRAQQADQLGAKSNESVAASKPAVASVENAIKAAVGKPLAGAAVDPSVPFAEAAAIGELHRRARQLRQTNNLEWGEAYLQAGKELAAEIEAGSIKKGNRWFVDGKLTGEYRFPEFTSTENQSNSSNKTVKGWLTQATESGRDIFNDQSIFTAADAKVLSNPNNSNDTSAELKLRTILNRLNENGAQMTLSEAKQMVLDSHGLKSERPFEPDALEVTALDEDMLSELYSPYRSGPNSVAVQGSQPPPYIRQGVEGAQDVIQASVSLGAPARLAPLAAAVFANETGWGKYTSGQNNLFNIKSTDGTGTVTTTREGDINGSGPSTSERAQWRDYNSGSESVRDFWEFLKSNERYAAVLTAATPMEALQELKAAGYATSPSYVRDVSATWETMGIDPNRPFQPRQITSSPWGNTSVMSPTAAVYITDNIGPTSTGQHLDVKRVDGSYFEYGELDEYVDVEDPEFGRVPLSRVPETGDWNYHTNKGSHGRDYGTYAGSELYLKNGATVVSNEPTEHGDYLVIQLPNGDRYSFLHGKAA